MKAQTETMRHLYGLLGDNFKSLEVLPLPDYVESLHPPHASTKKLKIGVIGGIGQEKGSDLVEKLNRIADVFVFGSIFPVCEKCKSEPFNNISQLNSLLMREK